MEIDVEKFRNKLVVFEAPGDHSGKTTMALQLQEHLAKKGIDVIYTKQPGDAPGEVGKLTRSLCIDKVWGLHPLSNLFAFLLDRAEHVHKVVIPALESGKTVICDRWGYSTVAYQFHGKELLKKFNVEEEFAEKLNALASGQIDPDVVFFLERDAAKVAATPDNQADQFETASADFKQRVSDSYYEQAKKHKFVRIPVLEGNFIGTLESILSADF